MTDGHTWKLWNVASDKVYKRMNIVQIDSPDLWPFVVEVIEDSIKKGHLKP